MYNIHCDCSRRSFTFPLRHRTCICMDAQSFECDHRTLALIASKTDFELLKMIFSTKEATSSSVWIQLLRQLNRKFCSRKAFLAEKQGLPLRHVWTIVCVITAMQ